jgi:hypothetical protein
MARSYFFKHEIYIVQQDDDHTFLAQVLHRINQAIHLYLDSCSKNPKFDVRENLLHHDEKRNQIEPRNFTQKLPTAIKMIFQTTVDKKMTKIMLMVASANPMESKNLMRMINNWVNASTIRSKNSKSSD